MGSEKQCKNMDQVVAKVWADDAFKQRLLKDPAASNRRN